jgi:polysaccharide export outer membrane protein
MSCTCSVPRELEKVPLPDYIIEPPDILLLGALRLVPLPTQEIQPLDKLLIQFPSDPSAINEKDLDNLAKTNRVISDVLTVDPSGTVYLGPRYGRVTVAGLLLDKARAAVEKRLKEVTAKELVDAGKFAVELAESRAGQQISGEHLVRQDGKVVLGIYGSVRVSGLTLEQARVAIEEHLSHYLLNPEVSVDIGGYNSKVYYIIADGATYGDQVTRLPIVGGETVLDALSNTTGLGTVASKSRIWLARPAPAGQGENQLLPVDWDAIVRHGSTATNYQVLPGDRIYIAAQPIVTFNNALTKILAPIEHALGITLLGNTVAHELQGRSSTTTTTTSR